MSVNNFRPQKQRGRAAFTLVELVITIALFALVGGLVISFITFMQRFTYQNEKYADRIGQYTDIRREIDYWFSFFDASQYTIEIPDAEQGENAAIARAVEYSAAEVRVAVYEIKFMLLPVSDGGNAELVQTLIFEYPDSAFHGEEYVVGNPDETLTGRQVRVPCPDIYSVQIRQYSADFVPEDGIDENDLRFLVSCRVTGAVFICEVKSE